MHEAFDNPTPATFADAKWAVAELKQSLLALSIELSDLRRKLDAAVERTAHAKPAPRTPPPREAAPIPIALRVYPGNPTQRKPSPAPRALPARALPEGQRLQAIRLEFAGS